MEASAKSIIVILSKLNISVFYFTIYLQSHIREYLL